MIWGFVLLYKEVDGWLAADGTDSGKPAKPQQGWGGLAESLSPHQHPGPLKALNQMGTETGRLIKSLLYKWSDTWITFPMQASRGMLPHPSRRLWV